MRVAASASDIKMLGFFCGSFVTPYSQTEVLIMRDYIRNVKPFSREMTNTFLQHFKVLFFLLSPRRLNYRNGWHRQNVTTHNYGQHTHVHSTAAKPIKCNYLEHMLDYRAARTAS